MNIDEYLELIHVKEVNKEDSIHMIFKNDYRIDSVFYNNKKIIDTGNIEYHLEEPYIVYELHEKSDVINNINYHIPMYLIINNEELIVDKNITLPLISMKYNPIKFKIYKKDLRDMKEVYITYDRYIFSNTVKHEFKHYNKLELTNNSGYKFINGSIHI